MKTKKDESLQSARKKYTAQFKEQVVERIYRDGVPKSARDLGIAESMLYSLRAKNWRGKASPNFILDEMKAF
ncbi:MAG: transposase [Methylococcaceae bacterium]|jgi:transposase